MSEVDRLDRRSQRLSNLSRSDVQIQRQIWKDSDRRRDQIENEYFPRRRKNEKVVQDVLKKYAKS